MNEQIKRQPKPHTLILENRAVLILTGVIDVAGFDEQTVNMLTDLGGLVVKGVGLHISKLSLETGEVTVEGSINSLQYTHAQQSKSVISKIFR